jgi:hypothetical protein
VYYESATSKSILPGDLRIEGTTLFLNVSYDLYLYVPMTMLEGLEYYLNK